MYLKYNFGKHIRIRETGFAVQPNLFWLGVSPDGLIIDSKNKPGLIEI